MRWKKHLKDRLFHGFHKQLHNSVHYLYGDTRITYPQLVTAPHKAESEQKDLPGEAV